VTSQLGSETTASSKSSPCPRRRFSAHWKQTIVTYGPSPGVTFSRDGSRLIVAKPNENPNPLGFLHEYDISVAAWLIAACLAAGRDLTADESRQFVHDNVPADMECG
jgi:hypothetical protein